MNIQSVNANKLIGLQDFLTDAQHIVDQCGNSPLLVLSNNKPAFYVMPTRAWELICTQLAADQNTQGFCQHVAAVEENAESKRQLVPKSDFILGHIPDQRTFDRKNNFVSLAEKLLDLEWERVNRGELSAASVAIQKNRLDAHVLPFFRYVAPAQTTHIDLDGFVSRLTQHQLSSTTISQYLVLVRKLLKLAVRQGLLKEVPEFPQVRVNTQPRTMLTLAETGR